MRLESILRRSLIFLIWWLKGLKIYRLYKELQSREYWTKQQWEDFQNKNLKIFINHCCKNVPYYNDLFKKNNINPNQINSIDDLHLIPILNKQNVRENLDQLVNNLYNKNNLKKGHTTGSTGSPLTYYTDKNRAEYLTAGLWRIYSRCGWNPGERIASIWGFKPKEMATVNWKRSIRDFFNGTTRLNAWKANDKDFKRWYKLIKRQKVRLIVCYASTGSRFANWLIDNNLDIPGIKGVYCTSEKLYDSQQEQIEKAFKCKVYNLYGCGEVNHIACTCENGKMHLNPDMAIVEYGESNEIAQQPLILTGFHNLATSFLRYTNGDAGSLSQESCNCGRQSPILDLKVSRLADVFQFADGKKYPSLYFILRLYKEGFDGIELFQFHQDKKDHVFLRIIKNKKFSEQTEINLKTVVKEIESHIDFQAKIELLYVDYIEQSATSKHYYAKSDIA